MEADLRRLLQVFEVCGKPRITLAEMSQALRQFSQDQLYGAKVHHLKLKQEILLFNHVFRLEKDFISLHSAVNSSQADTLYHSCGLRDDRSLVVQSIERMVGVSPLQTFALSQQYPVVIAPNVSAVDQWVSELYAQRVKLVGIDTESPVSFKAGAQLPVALVQIATIRSCLLAHLPRFGKFPRSLAALLADPQIAKAGFGVFGDFSALRAQLGLQPRSGLDVSSACAALSLRPMELGTLGVQTGAASLLGLYTQKSKDITCSNWARDLAPKQVNYAVTDAVLSLNCALQLLMLAPGRVVPGLCVLPSDHTLALATGTSTLLISRCPDTNAVLVALTKGAPGFVLHDMTGKHMHMEVVERLKCCRTAEEAENIMETGKCFESKFLTVAKLQDGQNIGSS